MSKRSTRGFKGVRAGDGSLIGNMGALSMVLGKYTRRGLRSFEHGLVWQFLRDCIHYRLGGWGTARPDLQRGPSKQASSTTRGRVAGNEADAANTSSQRLPPVLPTKSQPISSRIMGTLPSLSFVTTMISPEEWTFGTHEAG